MAETKELDFNISRGLSADLFPNGELNKQIIIEEGCWYLCTDTAELFLGLENGALKRINDVADLGAGEGGVDPAILAALNTEINNIKNSYALKSELPSTENFANKEFVQEEIRKITIPDVSKFITEDALSDYAKTSDIPSLDGYAKQSELFSKDYNDLVNKPTIPSVEGLATKAEIEGFASKEEIENLASTSYVDEQIKGIETNYALKSELDGKADSGHTHGDYLTSASLDGYAKTSDLFSKSYNDLTDKPEIPSIAGLATKEEIKDFVDTSYVDTKVDSIKVPTKVSELTDVDDYATKQFVTEAIATHADLTEVKTTLKSTVLPTVEKVETEIVPVVQELTKANNVPFTDSKIVVNSIGGFVAGEDIKDLTVAQLFAKLLGFSLEPSDKPEEPDVPDTPVDPDEPDPEIPKTSEEVVEDIVTQMNTATPEEPVSVMQTIAADGTFAEVKQSEIITFDPTDETSPNAEDAPTKSGFYQIKDETGTIVESGFQEMQIDSGDVYYSIVLPKDIDYNTMITLQAYNSGDGPISAGWYEIQKYAMLSSRENYDEVKSLCDDMGVTEEQIENIHNADYTLWITEETPNGDKVRYVIN